MCRNNHALHLTKPLHVRFVRLVAHAAHVNEGHMLRLLPAKSEKRWIPGNDEVIENKYYFI